MKEQNFSEKEALDLIACVFDRNLRRMHFVRGELFVFWGLLLSLTALAEYGLYRWTGDARVLWSWFVPLAGGYIWSAYNRRRRALVRTGFDNLLILVWTFPAMLSAASIVYAVTVPGNTMNPVGTTQLLLSVALLTTAEFFRGKGSNHSGPFVALQMLAILGIVLAFNLTFRMPFDAASGRWMLHLGAYGILLVALPGLILRHIARRSCSRS